MKLPWKPLAAATAAIGILAITAVIHPLPRVIWNASASVPIGLYAVDPRRSPERMDIAVVHPPEPLARFLSEGGYLPEGVPLLKHVAALPGQRVCRRDRTITIDGVMMGEALSRDRRGRPLPVWRGCQTLAADQVFLLNPDSTGSLDGRYFGPLPASAILGVARPLWTAEDRQS